MNHSAYHHRPAVAAAALAMALGVLATQALAQTQLTAEERLEALRHSLVQAAMEGPTQVRATSWIDAQGVLRDSSSFRSGMQVRGVKVLSYARDAQGKPTADVRWQTGAAPSAAAPSAAARGAAGKGANACATDSRERSLQHLIGLRVSNQGHWRTDDVPLVHSVRDLLLSQWQAASDASPAWRLAERPEQGASSYEKVLLASSADDLPWQATLRLSAAPTPASTPSLKDLRPYWLPAGPAPVLVQVDFSLTARNQRKPLMEVSAVVAAQPERQSWSAPQLAEASREQIALQVQDWAQQLMQKLGCEPVRAEVTMTGKQEARINAGALAGVRVGDEWLLADGQRVPRQLLEPGAAAKTVLARVQSVSGYHAELQLLAGASPLVERSWRAWPAEHQQ